MRFSVFWIMVLGLLAGVAATHVYAHHEAGCKWKNFSGKFQSCTGDQDCDVVT